MQEINQQSWGSRIVSSFFGILIGFLLIIGSFVLIFWNEGHGLHTAKSLQQTLQVVIIVPNKPIQPENNLKVVSVSGLATTEEILRDPLLGISDKAIKLFRTVEMYQWKENVETRTEKQMGGSEKTIKTYSYEPVWSEKQIDSHKFKDQTNHQNPATMILKSQHQYAVKVTVGDFYLPPDLINLISGATPVNLSSTNTASLQAKLNKPVQHTDEGLYCGADPQSPQIGDLRIRVEEILPQTVTIIAQQVGNTFQPYIAPAGGSVILLGMGMQSPQQLIHQTEVENQMFTWVLRLISLIVMIIGVSLILKPLSVLADVLPFLGNIVGAATGFVAFLIGLILWALATAIAWFAVRPLGAIGLIILVIAVCYFVYKRHKSVKQPNP